MKIKSFNFLLIFSLLLLNSCTKSLNSDLNNESTHLLNSKSGSNLSVLKSTSTWNLKLDVSSLGVKPDNNANKRLIGWLDDLTRGIDELTISPYGIDTYLAEYCFARKPGGELSLNTQVLLVRGSSGEILGGSHFGSFIQHQSPPATTYCTWNQNLSLCTTNLVIVAPNNKLQHTVVGDLKHISAFSSLELQGVTVSVVDSEIY